MRTEVYKSQKTAELIRQRYMLKGKQLQQANVQLKSILTPKLLNLPNFLLDAKVVVFSEWLLLNQSVMEELDGVGLREIAKNK